MNSIKLLLTLTIALTLTGCGGGGSSSSSSFSSLVRYSELQPDVAIRNTSAITQQVTYTVDGNDDVSNIGEVTAAGSATVTEEYQDGTVNGEPDLTNDIHELSITSAEEAGGVFELQATGVDANVPYTYIGAFGAAGTLPR